MAQLERAMDQVNLRLEHVRLLACTHAHSDHWGQAAPIVDRAGCEFWMHPNHEHATRTVEDPQAALARRLEVGAPERRPGGRSGALRRAVRRSMPSGVARVIEPDRPLVDGVGDRDRPRRVDCARDARTRAVARLPVPARAPAADLRRPRARADLAVLRLRLDPRPGGGVPGLARCRRRARRAVGAVGARPAVRRRPRPHRGQPPARRRAARAPRSARWPPAPGPRSRLPPRSTASRMSEANAHWFLQETLCYLRHLEARAARREPEREGETGVRPGAATLTRSCQGCYRPPCASMRFSPARTSRSSRSSSSRPRPRGRASRCELRSRPCGHWSRTSPRSPTAPAARPATGPSRSPSGSSRTWGSRRWPTSAAWAPAARSCTRSSTASRPRGSRTCWRCGATRPAARPSGAPTPSGLRYSTELAALIRDRLRRSASAAACFPEVHPEAPDLAHDLRFLREKIDSGVSFLITQPVPRQRALLPLRRRGAGAPGSRSRSSPGSCRSPTPARSRR